MIETQESLRGSSVFCDDKTEGSAGLPPSDFSIRVEPLLIQTRAVMVLGRIGDKRALPILLDIQARQDLCPLRCEVDDAIKRIKEN